MAAQSRIPRFIDIGVNFTDPVFRGKHRGTQKHPGLCPIPSIIKHQASLAERAPALTWHCVACFFELNLDDFNDVIRRSLAAGVKSVVITGGSLHESQEAIKLARKIDVFATAGCHPTRSSEFDKFKGGPTAYLNALDELVSNNIKGSGPVVAIGECGLDYDRLHFADKLTQQKYFRSQLALAKKYSLPLFLHSRAAHKDFVRILTEEGFADDGGRKIGARGGVVHSFTGTAEEIQELTVMGFHISINGCGLKTAENLSAAATVPLERLLLETDAPWCSLTSAHASNSYLTTPAATQSSQQKSKSASSKQQPPTTVPFATTAPPIQPQPLSPSLHALYNPQPRRAPDRFVPGQPVKGRNEPCSIGLVAHVLAQLKGVELGTLTEYAWRNTIELFALETRGRSVQNTEDPNDDGELLRMMRVPENETEKVPPTKDFDIEKEEWPSL